MENKQSISNFFVDLEISCDYCGRQESYIGSRHHIPKVVYKEIELAFEEMIRNTGSDYNHLILYHRYRQIKEIRRANDNKHSSRRNGLVTIAEVHAGLKKRRNINYRYENFLLESLKKLDITADKYLELRKDVLLNNDLRDRQGGYCCAKVFNDWADDDSNWEMVYTKENLSRGRHHEEIEFVVNDGSIVDTTKNYFCTCLRKITFSGDTNDASQCLSCGKTIIKYF